MVEVDKNCRFYEPKFPKVEEMVVVEVTQVTPMGAYVKLLEYNNKEGMILLSELSRKRIRSVSKLASVGKRECVMVQRVDEDKGYIDLSRRRRNEDDVPTCMERYQNSRKVHGLLINVAKILGWQSIKPIYERAIWPLYQSYPHALHGLVDAVGDPERVFGEILNLDDQDDAKLFDAIKSVIQQKLKKKPSKYRTQFRLTCFTEDGINAIKDALRVATEQVNVQLVAPPLFDMTTMSKSNDEGVKRLNNALDAIKESIETAGGDITIVKKPECLTSDQEKDFEKLLKKLEEENREVEDDDEEA